MLQKKGKILFAALLLAGYTIGTEFTAIPSASGPIGLLPGIIFSLFIWIFLLCAGLLFLEATLISPAGSSVITICKNLAGPFAAALSGLAFCIINFYFLARYYRAVAHLTHHLFLLNFTFDIPTFYFYLAAFVLLFLIILLGTHFSARINFIIFTAMILCGISALILGRKDFKSVNLWEENWYLVFFAIPVMITSFDFQSIVPTLATYLQRHPRKLLHTILIGFSIPLLFYIVWQWFIFGISSKAELWVAFETGSLLLESIKLLKATTAFHFFFNAMGIFGAFSSLIGIGLALFDFLADAFKISLEKRKGKKRFFLCLLALFPILFVGPSLPRLFEVFPAYVIGFAEAFFIAILPIWLVIRLRYVLKLPYFPLIAKSKVSIGILAFAALIIFYIEGIQFYKRL